MKTRHPGRGSAVDCTELAGDGKSRRSFLQAAATSVAVAALPLAAGAAPAAAGPDPQPVSELEAILARYGSEFGAVREVRARRHDHKAPQEH